MVVVVIATIFALAWMFYRVSSLLNIPIPTLVKILGLDLPAPPRVSLHGVSADTITLHWSLPEKAGSVAKHIIQINGINVGESEKRGETSVTVTGLNPDQRYNVRVIAANAQNFQAPGQLIRLRTCAKLKSVGESHDGGHKGDSSDDAPSVHSTPDVPPSPHCHGHPNSHGQIHPKRTAKERRSSPAALEQNHNLHNHASLAQEDQRTVDSLARDLDAVRKEIQETEAQLAHTEEEYKTAEAVLRAELDTLKDKKNEEDAGRQRIRAETKSLEEMRRTAEGIRTRTEKSLRAKEYDIKRMQDDMTRWEEEKRLALEEVECLSKAAEKSKECAATAEQNLSSDIQETQRQISEMEEEIKSLVAAIKNLETQKEQIKAEEDDEVQKLREDSEKESMWRDRQRTLEMRYVNVYNAFQAAEIEFIRSRELLVNFQGRIESGSGADTAQKKPKRRRNRKSRTSTVSSPINGYPMQEYGFQDSGYGSIQLQQSSPTFSSSIPLSPCFNIANGTVSGPTEIPSPVAGLIMDYLDSDTDYINGTPMSPTANSLLPSNLFAFEDAPLQSPKATSPPADDIQPRGMLFDTMGFVPPQSPMSSGSVSTSPRSSFNHMPLFSSFSPVPRDSSLYLESERNNTAMSPIGTNRPISTPTSELIGEGENIAPKSSSRRFVDRFSSSFNRQRGKTVGFEGGPPALGQLRPSESHSFPKNYPTGLDPIGTRRRSGSHGSWANSLDFLHGTSRRTKPIERTNSENSRRPVIFNQFSPSFDPNKLFDQPVSPRPSSIASFDNPLPVPSSDASAAFGWPSADQFQSNGLGGTGGASHWADFRAVSRMSQSRPVSRPISPNANPNASTSSLSLFPGHVSYFTNSASTSGRPTTPRLNPAAPTFQSRMNTPVRTRSRSFEKDAVSINTDISGMSDTSLESVPTRESILSRFSALSKKGSTSKFNISWGRSRRKDAGVDDELEEEPVADSATSSKGSLWSGWKKDGEQESEDEEDRGRLTPLAKESSPWLKGSQSGFFGAIGRSKKGDCADEDVKEKEKGKNGKDKGKDKDKDDGGEKKGLGIFRRKTEKEREREDAIAADSVVGQAIS